MSSIYLEYYPLRAQDRWRISNPKTHFLLFTLSAVSALLAFCASLDSLDMKSVVLCLPPIHVTSTRDARALKRLLFIADIRHWVLMVNEGFNTLSNQSILMIPVYITLSVTYLFIIAGSIGYVTYRPGRKPHRIDNVEFVLVTVGNERVKNALRESLTHLRWRFKSYATWVVVDEGAALTHYLSEQALLDPRIKLVVVPARYMAFWKGKARAMCYFIEHFVDSRNWYVFLDDDNLILSDDFLYEIPYYEERGYVAFNPILKPRKSRSTLAYIIDWMRYFNDLTLYRFFTGLIGSPFLGLHGELLGVKGDVLKGLDLGPASITEDFRIAVELVRRGYKTWQSSTIVSIKSPNSLCDLQMQRARWFKGIMSDLRHAPNLMRVLIIARSFTWVVGIIAVVTVIVFAGHNAYLLSLLALSMLYYWSIYVYGVYKSGRLRYFLITPFAWLIEVSSVFRVPAVNNFYVINKD